MVPDVQSWTDFRNIFQNIFPVLKCHQKRKFKIERKTTIDAQVKLSSWLNMLCHTDRQCQWSVCIVQCCIGQPGARRCCILSPRHLTWEMQIKALVLDKWMIAGLDTIMKQLRNTNDLDCSARLAFIHAGNRSTQRIFINVRHKYFLCHDAHEHDCHTFSLVTNTKHDKRKMTREPARSSTAIIARSMY